jgi:hypothetical protein
MITVDSFLIDLDNTKTYATNNKIPKRDRRIIGSLARQIKSGAFLTKNQADLLVKILKENMVEIDTSLIDLENPEWSKDFRKLDQVKNLYVDGKYLIIEFTFNKRIKQLVTDLNKTIDGQLLSNGNKQYLVPLTERNVYLTLNALRKEKFNISDTLLEYYKEIDTILKTEADLFQFESVSNERLLKKLGSQIDLNSRLHLVDRKIAYQYSIDDYQQDNSLTTKIANRPCPRVHVNSATTQLTEVVNSLIELKRFPLLVIFNQFDGKELVNELRLLKSIVTDQKVGVYFRMDNSSSTGIEFNLMVKEYEFNSRLDANTNIVGLTNNHLPKFIFNSGWYPRTVISFTNNFRNNKTSTYCDAVDLIVYYNKSAPVGGNVHEIV